MFTPGSKRSFEAAIAAQGGAGATKTVDAEFACEHGAVNVIALPLEASDARDMGDQDRREPLREVSARIAANPLEPDMPGLRVIEHDLHMDHHVLFEGRMRVVVPVDERPTPVEIARSRRGKQHIQFGSDTKPGVVAGEELFVDPGAQACPIFLLLVPMAREGEIGMVIAAVVNEDFNLFRGKSVASSQVSMLLEVI